MKAGAAPDPVLPARTSVVVIGGGVAGVTAALFLAEAGVAVVLCEKGRIAGEQSSRNWGWVRKQGRSPQELPLMVRSMDLWKRIVGEVDGDIGFRVGGVTYLVETDAEMHQRLAWLDHARAHRLDTRMLSAAETDELLGRTAMPGRTGRFKGALHTPSDAYAEPALAVPAMARLARERGAMIAEGVAVRGLYREGGRVRGVVTEHGTVRSDAVILAGGIWSRSLLENEGMSLPQLAVRSSVLRTSPAPRFSTSTFGAAGASIRPRADGGYTVARSGAAGFEIIPAAFRHFRAFWPLIRDQWRIMKLRAGPSFFGPLGRHRWDLDEATPFEQVRVMDPRPDATLLDDVMAAARDLYPQLEQARPLQTWAGMIDVMPDELPVIDRVEAAPGLVLATGLSGHGFGLGPGVGRLAAQLATGDEPIVDPAPFALSRFARRGGPVPRASAP